MAKTQVHREHLLLALMGALGLPQLGCGEKFKSEICRDIPPSGQCMSRRDLWKELRWNRKGCGKRLVSIDSEATIKYPPWHDHLIPDQSFTTSESPASQAPETTQGSGVPGSTTSSTMGSTATSTTSATGSTGSTAPSGSTSSAPGASTSSGSFYPPRELACCFEATWRHNKLDGCIEGRPLLQGVSGQPVLASIRSGQGWASEDLQEALPVLKQLTSAQREAMAKEWRKIAVQEHASIAAFAQLCLELLRYGAPAELVEACQSCMQDEIRHAKLAFRWASHLSGQELAPGPMPQLHTAPPSESLMDLALANLEEGCCNETLATLLMLDRADRCEHEGMRRVVAQIAQDEQRHAQFAWRLTQWFLAKEPALWRVLDARMQELIATGKETGTSHAARVLREGKHEVLEPLWAQLKMQSGAVHLSLG